jgi:integrase
MKITKRGKFYWFSFRYKKKRYRKSTHHTNKQDAENYAAAWRTKLINGEVGIKEQEEPKVIPTFRQAVKDFLAWSKTEHAAHPATHRRYEVSGVALLKYFGDTPLDQIESDDVEGFKASRIRQRKLPPGRRPAKSNAVKASAASKVMGKVRGKRKARRAPVPKRKPAATVMPATVNRELACLKILFNRFKRVVPLNPVSGVKFLSENNEQMRVLTAEEEKLYLLAAPQPLQDAATLMLETGMRPDEVYRIERRNVHLDDGEGGYYFNPFGKTKAARRKVPLSARAAEVLGRRMENVKGELLFPGRGTGRPVVKLNNAHAAALERSGVARFRIYDLRHTWATRAAEAGVDLVTLAALLGHSRIQMVLRYAHPSEEHQFAAVKKVEAARAAARK